MITAHAESRLKTRVGLSKSRIEKDVQSALGKGLRHCETKGSLNRYLSSLYFYKQTANNLRIWNGRVYVFAGTTLITVLDLPAKYRHNYVNAMRKRGDNHS